jgi:hypothetical protein
VTPRRAERLAVGGREQRQRLGVVLDLAADGDQDRLVVADQADDVLAGDVGRGDDDDLRPVERVVELETDEPGVGVGRADRRAVPGAIVPGSTMSGSGAVRAGATGLVRVGGVRIVIDAGGSLLSADDTKGPGPGRGSGRLRRQTDPEVVAALVGEVGRER